MCVCVSVCVRASARVCVFVCMHVCVSVLVPVCVNEVSSAQRRNMCKLRAAEPVQPGPRQAEHTSTHVPCYDTSHSNEMR